jgi:hypothetical protein
MNRFVYICVLSQYIDLSLDCIHQHLHMCLHPYHSCFLKLMIHLAIFLNRLLALCNSPLIPY